MNALLMKDRERERADGMCSSGIAQNLWMMGEATKLKVAQFKGSRTS